MIPESVCLLRATFVDGPPVLGGPVLRRPRTEVRGVLVVEVIVLCMHWQLVHVVQDQVLAALRQGRQRPHIEEQALVEKADVRDATADKLAVVTPGS